MTPRKKKKKKKKRNNLQRFVALTMGLVLGVCAASVAVGVMNRHAGHDGERIPQGVRIEVLNGTGEKGLAREVAVALMKRRIDVLHVGNADNFDYRETVLIARKRRPEIRSLGKMLGCDRFVEQLREDTMVDATLVVGADYRRLSVGNELDSDLLE